MARQSEIRAVVAPEPDDRSLGQTADRVEESLGEAVNNAFDPRQIASKVGRALQRSVPGGSILGSVFDRLRGGAAGGGGGAGGGATGDTTVAVAQLEALQDIRDILEKRAVSGGGGAGGGGGGGAGLLGGLGIARLLGGGGLASLGMAGALLGSAGIAGAFLGSRVGSASPGELATPGQRGLEFVQQMQAGGGNVGTSLGIGAVQAAGPDNLQNAFSFVRSQFEESGGGPSSNASLMQRLFGEGDGGGGGGGTGDGGGQGSTGTFTDTYGPEDRSRDEDVAETMRNQPALNNSIDSGGGQVDVNVEVRDIGTLSDRVAKEVKREIERDIQRTGTSPTGTFTGGR